MVPLRHPSYPQLADGPRAMRPSAFFIALIAVLAVVAIPAGLLLA